MLKILGTHHSIFALFQTTVLSKLAAAHRGALRVLQTFTHHLPDYNLHQHGLPRCYHELVSLLTTLTAACGQLEVAGVSGVPDSVMCLVREVEVGMDLGC